MSKRSPRGVPPGCPLSRRQFEAVFLGSFGDNSYEVAEQMGIAATTVRQHWWDAARKLGVRNLRAAILYANEHDWWDADAKPKVENGFAITPFMREYLAGFDRTITSDEDEAAIRHRDAALLAMIHESGANARVRVVNEDPLLRLLRAVLKA